MVRVRAKEMLTLKIKVSTEKRDVEAGKCGLPSRCMEKLAITRALWEQLKLSGVEVNRLNVRVDGGHIRFNYKGHRWTADTPYKAKNALIRFDRGEMVEPHRYAIVARRGAKVKPLSDAIKSMMAMSKEQKIRDGADLISEKFDKKKKSKATIHQRVVGFAEGYN